MPVCPHCGAEVQPEDINCGNRGGDLREAPPPGLSQEEGPSTPAEGMEELLPSEEVPEAGAPALMSPISRTLWIVVGVVLFMLLCCCGILGSIALARILG